jgi:hypothetical protein
MRSLCAVTGKRWVIPIFCLVLLSAFLPSIGQSETAETVVAVMPGKVVVEVNDVFAVDIWIDNIIDLRGWEVSFFWNRSMLYCTKARVNTPIEWGGMPFDCFNKTAADVDRNAEYTALQFGDGICNEWYLDGYGAYMKCESAIRAANSVNRSLSIITLWFKALQTGSTFLDLDYPHLTFINRGGIEILTIGSDGVVEIREPMNIPTQHSVWLKK